MDPKTADSESMRNSILQNLSSIDKEIAVLQSEINVIHQQRAANAANQERLRKKLQGLNKFEQIVAQNRLLARKSRLRTSLPSKPDVKSAPKLTSALCQSIYQENLRRFEGGLKDHILQYLLKREEENASGVEQERPPSVSAQSPKTQDSRLSEEELREIFEEAFPVLKENRISQENGERLCKEDASCWEAQEYLAQLTRNRERQKALSVVPFRYLGPKERALEVALCSARRYPDSSEALKNAGSVSEHMLRKWSKEECDIFTVEFLRTPKDFVRISKVLQTKTVGQCIEYYYLTKHSTGYKGMLRDLRKPIGKRILTRASMNKKKEAAAKAERTENASDGSQ